MMQIGLAVPMTTHLNQMADILPGYPFRGALESRPDGNAWVIQVRHVSSREWISLDSKGSAGDGKALDRVQLPGRRAPDYVQPGDVLFMARGPRNGAVLVEKVPEGTVCTPHFFLIRLKPAWRDSVDPRFLVWQLNHGEGRAAIAAGRQGSLVPSVRKTELAAITLQLPSLADQGHLAKLHQAADREARILQKLIENRHREITAIGRTMLDAVRNG